MSRQNRPEPKPIAMPEPTPLADSAPIGEAADVEALEADAMHAAHRVDDTIPCPDELAAADMIAEGSPVVAKATPEPADDPEPVDPVMARILDHRKRQDAALAVAKDARRRFDAANVELAQARKAMADANAEVRHLAPPARRPKAEVPA